MPKVICIRKVLFGKVALVMAACVLALTATLSLAAAEDPNAVQLLKQRAEARWQALAQRDYEAAYAYQSPTYRSLFSLEQFQREGVDPVTVRRFNVDQVELAEAADAEAATVIVHVEYRPPFASAASGSQADSFTMVNTYRERWLFTEGEWWYVSRS